MKKRNAKARYGASVPYPINPSSKGACRQGWLFEQEYKEVCTLEGLDELSRPGTLRTDHTSCPAGQDTRGRLYFTTVTEQGKYLVKAYCHNCRQGAVKELYPYEKSINDPSSIAVSMEDSNRLDYEFPQPSSLIHAADPHIPYAAYNYFRQYGLVSFAHISPRFSEPLSRIIIPVWRFSSWAFASELEQNGALDASIDNLDGSHPSTDYNKYMGYIARVIPGKERPGVSRWITASCPEGLRSVIGDPKHQENRKVVFCEDVVSAARIAQDGNAMAVPLFGLNVPPEWVLTVTTKYLPDHRPVVWLDNDAPSIPARQRLVTLLQMFGKSPLVVEDLSDPKKQPAETIQSVLVD